MINGSLLKLLFVWNFHNSVEFSLIFISTAKQGCVIKTREMLNFFPLINNLVTTGLSVLLLSISAIILSNTVNILRFLFRLYSSIFL